MENGPERIFFKDRGEPALSFQPRAFYRHLGALPPRTRMIGKNRDAPFSAASCHEALEEEPRLVRRGGTLSVSKRKWPARRTTWA